MVQPALSPIVSARYVLISREFTVLISFYAIHLYEPNFRASSAERFPPILFFSVIDNPLHLYY